MGSRRSASPRPVPPWSSGSGASCAAAGRPAASSTTNNAMTDSRGRLIWRHIEEILAAMTTHGVYPDEEPGKAARALATQVEEDGGRSLALYRDPVGGHWQIFCLLPLERVEPTPYQRDLSPTHVKRLQEVVRKIDRFVDPIVV